jgi:hypothetical protein
MKALLLGGLLVGVSANAYGFSELTDARMAEVTAGTATIEIVDDVARFQFHSAGRNGRSIDGFGSLSITRESGGNNLGQLVLSDSAQGNLRALVNINAVQSPVQVLLNLNLNVNSAVGTVRQFNLAGQLR